MRIFRGLGAILLILMMMVEKRGVLEIYVTEPIYFECAMYPMNYPKAKR